MKSDTGPYLGPSNQLKASPSRFAKVKTKEIGRQLALFGYAISPAAYVTETLRAYGKGDIKRNEGAVSRVKISSTSILALYFVIQEF